MWRKKSLSLSSKLVNPTSNPYLILLLRSSKFHHHGIRARSSFTCAESTSAADPINWAQSGPAVPNIGPSATSASVSSLPSLTAASALKAKEVAFLAKHYGRCYWELSKARLSMLVVATSGTGYILGSGSSVDYLVLCCTCAGTMMVAASANSLNQVFEVKNDAMMNRTRQRPLPSGRINIPHAVTWASFMGIAGTTLLACKANILAAGFAASNLVLYAFVYTPLKQIHPVNTWVGAIVGAIPPLLGEAEPMFGALLEVKDVLEERFTQQFKQNLVQAQSHMKFYADCKRQDRVSQVGDRVYLKLQPYKQNSMSLRKNLKLSARYYGRILS
ncbi:hypothetical protein OROGR_033119 [Orobanche gracilis]